jgi:uncharacterized protein YkwD
VRELLKDKANKFDSITKDVDGTKDVRIVRHWWARSPQAASRFTDPTTIRGTAPEIAALTVARDTGEFSFTGGSGARFDGPLTATGLSADAKAGAQSARKKCRRARGPDERGHRIRRRGERRGLRGFQWHGMCLIFAHTHPMSPPISRPAFLHIFSPRCLCIALAVLLGIVGIRRVEAVEMSADEKEIAARLTGDRGQRRDRSRMHADPILTAVARARAEDMARRRYVAHVNPDGFGPNALVRAAGYSLPSFWGDGRSKNFIESIGAGSATAEQAWEGWMRSSAHRTHLLASTSFYRDQTNFGIGSYFDPSSPYRRYWVIITAPPSSRGAAVQTSHRTGKAASVAVSMPVWSGGDSDADELRERVPVVAPRPSAIRVPAAGKLWNWAEPVSAPRPRVTRIIGAGM